MASSFAIFEFVDAPDEGFGEQVTPRTANKQRMDLLRHRQMGNAVKKGTLGISTIHTYFAWLLAFVCRFVLALRRRCSCVH